MISLEVSAICGALFIGAYLASSRVAARRLPIRKCCYRSVESAGEARQAFARLCREDDVAYLRRIGERRLAKRLRRERRQVLADYLRQTRIEFAETASWARALSARTDSPEIASRVLKASLAFESLHLLLWLEVRAGAWLPLPVDVSGLTRRLDLLQATVGNAVAPPQLAASR